MKKAMDSKKSWSFNASRVLNHGFDSLHPLQTRNRCGCGFFLYLCGFAGFSVSSCFCFFIAILSPFFGKKGDEKGDEIYIIFTYK